MRGLRDVSWFSAAHYVSEALFLARGILLAALIGPSAFGIWSSMRIVGRFVPYIPAGSLQGMLQLSPHLDGQGDSRTADAYRATAAAMGLGTALAAGGLIGAVSWLASPSIAANAWLIFAAVLVLSQLYDVQLTILRSQQEFVTVSAATVGFAVCSTLLGTLAAWRFGLTGFLVAMCIAYAVVTGLVAATVRKPISARFEPAKARQLVGTGSRILLAQGLLTLMQHLDKLLLFALLGSTALGLYAVPSYIVDLMLLMPAAIAAVAYPQLLVSVAQTASFSVAWPYLERATIIIGLLACPVLGLLCLTVHLPIQWWLPDYTAAIEAGRILILVAFLPMVAALPATVLISLDAHKKLIGIRCLALVVSVASVYGVILAGGGLREVALATAPGFALLSVATLLAALRHAGLPRSRQLRALASMYAPYGLLIVLVGVLGSGGPDGGTAGQLLLRISGVCVPLVIWSVLDVRRLGMLRS